MAKGNNGLRNKKTHSSKPYDVSNSFVKKVASRVTSFLPQSSWLSKWFTSVDESHKPEENDSDSDDDIDINPPSRKRAKIELNQQIPVNNYRVGAFTNSEVSPERTDVSMLLEQAGPSGFSRMTGRQELASSTPIENEARASLASSHLNMRPRLLLSNALNQPSPLVNNIDRKMNGDDRSESSESTSGCSSLLPQVNRQMLPGELQQDRNNRTSERSSLGNHMGQRSLILNRTRSPTIHTPLSRRRTMFNVSSFTSPLEADKSLSRSAVINSPFYQGRTSYGGASALQKSRDVLFSPRQTCIRRTGIEVKPINAENSKGSSDMTTMSQTARRILEALEQFSSPIQDAKKMVVGQGAFPVLGSKRPRPEAKQQEARPASSLRQLTIPTVPDLIKLRRREKLQDSLEAARIIANSAKQESSYQLRLENSSAVGKVLGKKANIENEETVEEVHLPSVPLPITSLPKFDIIVPETSKSVSNEKFKFSSPIVVSEITRTVPSINNFTFSKPFSVANFIKNSLNNVKVTEVGNFIPCCPSKLDSTISNPQHSTVIQLKSANIVSIKNNGPSNYIIEAASELKSGSVSDILGKSKPEDSTKSHVNFSFGTAFKPPPDTWECSTCLIRNKQEATRCVACSESRISPNATGSYVLPATTNAESIKFQFGSISPSKKSDSKLKIEDFSSPKLAKSVGSKPLNNEQQSFNIGEKFKPTVNTWECQTCMVRNNETHLRCQACETAKSVSPIKVTSLVDKFKKPADSWECPTCMVSNKGDILKCVACEEPKPGSSNDAIPKSSTKFNIDIPAESKMFKFGLNRDDISTQTNNVTHGFKFGDTQNVAVPTTFTFGIKSSNDVCVPESITCTSADTTSKTDNFTFAIPQASKLKQSPKDMKKNATLDSVDSEFDSKDKKNDTNLNFISQPNKVLQSEKLAEDNVSQPDNAKTAKEIGVSNQLPPTTITFTASKPPVSVNEKQELSTPQFKFVMPTNCDPSSEMSTLGKKSNPFSFEIKPNADICPVSSSTNSSLLSGEKVGFTFGAFVQQATTQSTAEEKTPILASTPITTLANNLVSGEKGAVASNFGQTNVTSSQILNKVDARSTVDQVGQSISSSVSTLGATTAAPVVSTAPSPFSATTFVAASGSSVSAPVSVSSSTLTSLSVTTTTVANFGNLQTTAVSTSGSVTSSSAPSFGTNVASVPAFGSTGSTFGFGSSSVSPISNFGIPVTTTATKTSITFGPPSSSPATFGGSKSGFEQVSDIPKPFGFPVSDSIPAKPTLSPFGTAATSNSFGNANTPVPSFGNPITTSPFILPTTTPSFGLSVPAFTSAPSFDAINSSVTANSGGNFNNSESSINTGKPSSSPFVFSANSNKASPFSFGPQNNAAVASIPPAKITGFSFGSSNSSNTPSGNMPQSSGFANYSFGANAPTANTPAANMFGSNATPPAFGSSNTGSGFAQPSFFGSNPQASSIFGLPANQGASTQPVQNSTPVFTFGTAAAQPAGLPPTFDPTVKPSFKFTGGETPSFTAEAIAPPRRFKKAVRRTSHVR